tara:strand:- start:1844 stop:1957 length:114 start_codon:yes stop_codon:yes gene_type:complete
MENWKNGMTALFEMKLDDLTAGKKDDVRSTCGIVQTD